VTALAPPGCLCQPLFLPAADRRWRCVEVSPGDVPAARRGPRMRQPIAAPRAGEPSAPKPRQRPPLRQPRACGPVRPVAAARGPAAITIGGAETLLGATDGRVIAHLKFVPGIGHQSDQRFNSLLVENYLAGSMVWQSGTLTAQTPDYESGVRSSNLFGRANKFNQRLTSP